MRSLDRRVKKKKRQNGAYEVKRKGQGSRGNAPYITAKSSSAPIYNLTLSVLNRRQPLKKEKKTQSGNRTGKLREQMAHFRVDTM